MGGSASRPERETQDSIVVKQTPQSCPECPKCESQLITPNLLVYYRTQMLERLARTKTTQALPRELGITRDQYNLAIYYLTKHSQYKDDFGAKSTFVERAMLDDLRNFLMDNANKAQIEGIKAETETIPPPPSNTQTEESFVTFSRPIKNHLVILAIVVLLIIWKR